MSGRSNYELNVHKVQLHCTANNKEHHTDDIAVNRLIVRRGQPFQLTFHAEQPFRPRQDFFQLIVQTGPNASEAKGTRSTFGLQARCGLGKSWSMELSNSTDTSFTMTIYSPPDACIGLYKLSMLTGTTSTTETSIGTLTVLFNPWCKDDSVYLPKKEERQEYVMNEQGLLYRGNCDFIEAMTWDFGQFEDDIIDVCLKLLDVNQHCLRNAIEDFSARCSPIYVGRVVSAMINKDDADDGVLWGRWDDSYSDGVNPVFWSSSVDILRHWFKNECRPVKYGQCWVFAAVMCTVLRCLGIPCRVVTNFESAHDTNSNLLIDEYRDVYGLLTKEDGKDSIWNFHVWVEAWMKRPDISDSGFYDGWQVLDPTPQEMSEGVFCCGPAPVKAILEGHTNVKYDVPFVFAEVNADIVKWMLRPDGSKTKISTDTWSVGQFISTKAVGSDMRLDITNQYKYLEGSRAERDRFNRAVRNLSVSDDSEDVPASHDVLMTIQEVEKPVSGSDIKLSLTVCNKRSTPQTLSLQINAQTMRYTGIPTGHIYKEQNEVRLQPNGELFFLINIPFEIYGPKMLFNNSIKVSAIAKNEYDSKVIYMAEKNIVPQSPTLTLTVDETAVQLTEIMAKVVFENPLPETLKNCSITLMGSGLLQQPEIIRAALIGPRERMQISVRFRPYRTGLRKLVADFQCSAFTKINTSCNVDVIPSFI
ncbi:protein-glutamine gamma-glutamyltransferase 2-like [Colossoma macropomum]|uniref:protein-glutamine gamma-glutamyltransferase 2-like n=1 Tax=Colossoma macropomum TaxID=42526 RepID=UPI001864E4C2|nr:protein-glutamine gamma-glutamyltransferase 2-like [Colossoma macropomum]